jgi:choline-glycine betaine transporter
MVAVSLGLKLMLLGEEAFVNKSYYTQTIEELDGPTVSALRCAIAEVKQHWSVIGWVIKNVLSRVPPCFRKAR